VGILLRLQEDALFGQPRCQIAPEAWNQVKARLEFLAHHHGVGLLTGEVGAGKSTAARAFTATLNPNLYKILYVHFCAGSALDLLRQVAWELNLEPLRGRGDLARQIAEAVVSYEKSFFMFLLRLSFRPPVPPESRQPWNITGTLSNFILADVADAFLAVALARQRRFDSLLLTRFQIESVSLHFLDDVLLQDFALEAPQRVLKGFTILNVDLCQR
jgi:hypothetical protein